MLELRELDHPQSEVDLNQADAVARLLGALSSEQDALMQIGSLILVKVQKRFSSALSPRQSLSISIGTRLYSRIRQKRFKSFSKVGRSNLCPLSLLTVESLR
jgi:hypothetical protein